MENNAFKESLEVTVYYAFLEIQKASTEKQLKNITEDLIHNITDTIREFCPK